MEYLRRIDVLLHGEGGSIKIGSMSRSCYSAEHGLAVGIVYVLRLHGARQVGGPTGSIALHLPSGSNVHDIMIKVHVVILVDGLRCRSRGRIGRSGRRIVISRVQGRAHRCLVVYREWSGCDKGGSSWGEGKVRLIGAGGVKDGVVVEIECIKVKRHLRVAVGMA